MKATSGFDEWYMGLMAKCIEMKNMTPMIDVEKQHPDLEEICKAHVKGGAIAMKATQAHYLDSKELKEQQGFYNCWQKRTSHLLVNCQRPLATKGVMPSIS